MQPAATTSWYALPRYYELGMADETAGELRFVRDACARWVTGATRDILEPACGPGRLTVALARAGFNVRAFDLEPSMVDYARRKSQRYSSQVIVERGDMRSFSLPKQYDAAVCLLDSFRHLLTEADALAHLQAVARAVRSGGVYLLGLHLLPPDADLNCTERWSAVAGKLKVTTTLRVLQASRRARLERLRISILARHGERVERFRDEFDLRMYTAAQLRTLLAKVPQWQLLGVTDYWYDSENLLSLNNELSDTVLILGRV